MFGMERIKSRKIYRTVCLVCASVLVLYPLRHVCVGVDLLDGGYNYSNFRYCSLEYMDSMWYFATWLANHVGSLLMKLPFGSTMSGMNVYTGLLVSIMACASYYFCIKVLHMSVFPAFFGELLAISLCWAPTAVLYNYLTYAFLLLGICLLYHGLVNENDFFLAAAGTALGINVAVRFPNLVQMGLIVAVWLYGFFGRKKPSSVLKQTGCCVLGYVAALGAFLIFISLKYGFFNYAEAVARLFQMTENATDYAPESMLSGVVRAYLDNESTYWVKRFLVMFGGGFAACLVLPKKWVRIKKGLAAAVTFAAMLWFASHRYYSRDYATYEAMYIPCVMAHEMMILLSIWTVFDRTQNKDKKLFAVLLLLSVFVTPIGSNNAMYTNINNMFLTAPGFLWMSWDFCRSRKEILCFPLKCVLFAGIFFLMVQGLRFGVVYVYEEATGGRNMTAQIEEIPVLRGMKTDEEKAAALTGLYQYIYESGLQESRCILYGEIPGIAYYMEIKPAVNTWADLRSYSPEVMETALEAVMLGLDNGGEKPVVILEAGHALYVETGNDGGLFPEPLARQKMMLVCNFMEQYGYELTYYNEKFAVYRADS